MLAHASFLFVSLGLAGIAIGAVWFSSTVRSIWALRRYHSQALVPYQKSDPAQYEGYFYATIGNNLFKLSSSPFALMAIDDKPVIQINKRHDDWSIGLIRLFDDQQEVIFRSEGDKIWLRRDVRVERPNSSEIEVYDHNDEMILDLLYVDQNSLIVKSGVFRNRGHVATIDDETGDVLLDGKVAGMCSHNLYENSGLLIRSDGTLVIGMAPAAPPRPALWRRLAIAPPARP